MLRLISQHFKSPLYQSQNEVVTQPAIYMVPCKFGGAIINNVMTHVVTELIHFTVVKDSEHLKNFELSEQKKQDQEIEGFNTTGCMRTFGVIITSYVVFRTHDGQLAFRVLVSVV